MARLRCGFSNVRHFTGTIPDNQRVTTAAVFYWANATAVMTEICLPFVKCRRRERCARAAAAGWPPAAADHYAHGPFPHCSAGLPRVTFQPTANHFRYHTVWSVGWPGCAPSRHPRLSRSRARLCALSLSNLNCAMSSVLLGHSLTKKACLILHGCCRVHQRLPGAREALPDPRDGHVRRVRCVRWRSSRGILRIELGAEFIARVRDDATVNRWRRSFRCHEEAGWRRELGLLAAAGDYRGSVVGGGVWGAGAATCDECVVGGRVERTNRDRYSF